MCRWIQSGGESRVSLCKCDLCLCLSFNSESVFSVNSFDQLPTIHGNVSLVLYIHNDNFVPIDVTSYHVAVMYGNLILAKFGSKQALNVPVGGTDFNQSVELSSKYIGNTSSTLFGHLESIATELGKGQFQWSVIALLVLTVHLIHCLIRCF